MMGDRFSTSMITVAIAAAAVSTAISVPATRTSAQAPAFSDTALKTPWGEPDLQGIWTEEFDTPLQRPARYANQEFFTEPQRRYHAGNVARLNRSDGPEDDGLSDRCLRSGLPEFGSLFGGSFRRIVQTPGGISIFYDVNQGQGWQRNIVMNGSPHLPANIRQWFGDSRGHWEGDTLVVDVTNFSPKTDVFGSRENLHLVERWTRTGPKTLAYEVTIEDPTVWTKAWAVKQEFTRQSDEENRIYYEPRCIEGNYGLPGLLHGRRAEDRAFAEGRGPDPRTNDSVGGVLSVQQDPLQ